MVGKSSARLDAEVVEHQERGKVAQLGRADGTAHTGTGALSLLDGKEHLTNRAGNGHVGNLDFLFRIIKIRTFSFWFRSLLGMLSLT